MTKAELIAAVKNAKFETKSALQTVYDTMNKGQRKKIVKDEFTNWGTVSGKIYATWLFIIRFVCPICIAAIFAHQFDII